jgi:hypothetical protein
MFWMRTVTVIWSGLAVSPRTVAWRPLWCSNQYREMLRTVSVMTRSANEMSLARLGRRGEPVGVDLLGVRVDLLSVDVDI